MRIIACWRVGKWWRFFLFIIICSFIDWTKVMTDIQSNSFYHF